MKQSEYRTVLVTGATGAIGKAIARLIAAEPGFNVVLHGRDRNKAERAAEEIRQATGNPNVRLVLADVSRKAEIEQLAASWDGPLHVLINNAAATPRRRRETPEGIEMQFATNVLGYVWMTQAFSTILKDNTPARVVNVASYWAGDLDLDDLEFERRRYNNGTAYRQSKQANRMLTVAFAELFQPSEITVNVCHPGDVNSNLSNDLGFGGSQSPDAGAQTPVWLSTGSEGGQVTGKYFERRRQTHCQFSENKQAIKTLYEICYSY